MKTDLMVLHLLFAITSCMRLVGKPETKKEYRQSKDWKSKHQAIVKMEYPPHGGKLQLHCNMQYLGNVVATVGEDILIIGGYSYENKDGSVEVEIFNTQAQTFRDGSFMPKLLKNTATIVFRMYIILIGGLLRGRNIGHSMMLDTELNEWTILDKVELNTLRCGHDSVILADGTIIVCGGSNDTGHLDSIEIISFEDLTGIDGTYSLCIAGYYIYECILHCFGQHA